MLRAVRSPALLGILFLASSIVRATGPPEGGDWIDRWNRLNEDGVLAARYGRPSEAAEIHSRARALARRHEPGRLRDARSTSAVARALLEAERYPEARRVYEDALALWHALTSGDQPRTATLLHDLAWVELRLGDADRALEHAERAARLFVATLGADHAATESAREIARRAARVIAHADETTGSRPSPARSR